MIALEVRHNGRRACVAGIRGSSAVTAIVTSVTPVSRSIKKNTKAPKHDLFIQVGGHEARSGDHLHWLQRFLDVGDEITVRIVEADTITPAKSRVHHDVESERKSKAVYVQTVAKELGWKIVKA